MASPDAIMQEMERNLPVILLLMFMVAGIYFMKPLLLYTFTKIILGVRSKTWLSLMFCLASALLSAFLDALTVTAVIIGIAVGFTPCITRWRQARISIPSMITPTTSVSRRSIAKISRTSAASCARC